jgi:hypothetical protein
VVVPPEALRVAVECLATISTIQEALDVCDPQVTAALFGGSLGASLFWAPEAEATRVGLAASPPPTNWSGNPAGYNSDLFPSLAAVRGVLRSLGYGMPSNGATLSASDRAALRQFQRDYNTVSATYVNEPKGTLGVDGRLGRNTLNGIEFALNIDQGGSFNAMNGKINGTGWRWFVTTAGGGFGSTPAPPRAPAPNGNGSGPSPSFKATRRIPTGVTATAKIVVEGLTGSTRQPTTQQAPSQTPGSTSSNRRIVGIVDGADYDPAAFNGTEHEIPWRYFRGTLRSQLNKATSQIEGEVDRPFLAYEQPNVRLFQEEWNRLVRYLDARERSGQNVDPRLADVRRLLTVNRGLLGLPSLSDDDRSTLRAIEIAGAVSDGSPDWPALIKAIP